MAKKKTILTVEDDAGLRQLLVDLGSRRGYNMVEAEDGEVALKQIENKPDLILLDLMLPVLDGFGVLEKLRHDSNPEVATIPVVVLSNLWTNKDILRAKSLTIEAYLVKSSTPLPTVFEEIEKILK